jgi:4-hydroxy-tetrahydrodipicolinate synthase
MFHGSIPALVTPFKNGAIDREAFAALVERQIAGGSSALVPVGTTGETSTLSTEEHKEVVTLCVEVAAGRVPVIAGAGSNATEEAIDLVAHAKAVGADAALVVCPYYNNPNQDGLYAHFKAINDAVALPVVLYNVPSRTIADLRPETVARLACLPNIVGIKDATGDMDRVSYHAALIAEREQFVQLSGDDPSALGHLAMGGAGCISVTANVVPEACAAMQAAARDGDLDSARLIERRLIHLHRALFVSPSPGPAKYALSRLGLCAPDVRLPVTEPDAAARAIIDDALAAAGVRV